MIILGISDGHDAGACIVKDGKILASINEERLVREKLYTGVPKESIKKVMELSKTGPEKIDRVAIAGTLGLMTTIGWVGVTKKKRLYQFICRNVGFLASSNFFANLQRFMFRPRRTREAERFVRSLGIDCGVEYIDHHLCHAASAYYTSGRSESLVITSDGSGDGMSASVYKGIGGELIKVKEIPTYNSVAYYYGYVTIIAGLKMFRHEGKITGLAAHGDPKRCYKIFQDSFIYNDRKHTPVNTLGLLGEDAIKRLRKQSSSYRKEDYTAAVQKRVEDVMTRFVRDYVNITGINEVSLAGGIFANVKVNQKILELDNINSVFIHPNMGDGGLSLGAALYVSAREMLNNGSGLKPSPLNNVYFGPGYSNNEIEKALSESKLNGTYIKNIEKYIAEKVAKKEVVGHFSGRMEWGPRALGNRSILYDPTDKSINDWLNKRLNRTEYMPFAPSILNKAAGDYYTGYEKGEYPAKFMTITFDCKKPAREAKAVVHVDNTTRPQVVDREQNLRYYKILENYRKITGMPLFVNTSFNAHEEPIICSPIDAINSFRSGTVDVLIMENWALER